MNNIIAISAVIIQYQKLLIVRKKRFWILPGGKPEQGEKELECLEREVEEELSGTKIKNLNYYKDFEGITPNKSNLLRNKVYFAQIDGLLRDPSAEINGFVWMSYQKKDEYILSDVTRKIVNSLNFDGYF